ncbi:MAG: Xaa-Pro peptidase family protein [Candidatus Omnitrophica bacterium]|nr:Xaa-Pro peptidase family protein [Candidatus Omnitrophota bacterium]MBU1925089.1 Xaa-Pro peptidase family protein [Candidatus Omnitrophota bacterium]
MKNLKVNKVRHFLRQKGIDAFLVSPGANIRYLSGFTGTDSWLIITRSSQFFLGDFRFMLQAKREIDSNFEIIRIKESLNATLLNLAVKNRIKSICFEPDKVSVYAFSRIKNRLGKNIRLLGIKDVLERQRQIKSPEEIILIQKALAITKRAFELLKPFVKPKVTELFLKNKLEMFLKAGGAHGLAFDPIVASGPNAAMPHAKTTQRAIKPNEPVIIDAGVDYSGYKCDLTRTFFSGKITQYITYYNILRYAQLSAIKKIKPHAPIALLERTARQVLKAKGLEQYFGHALGHGVGLEVHETPIISKKNNRKLMQAMVVTIEPGIYIPGSGGVRIEDMVLVTKTGYKILSK